MENAEMLRRIRVNNLCKMGNIRPIIKDMEQDIKDLEQDLKILKKEYDRLEDEYKKADYKLALLDGRMEVVIEGRRTRAKLPRLTIDQIKSVARQLGIRL